jgi:hypothetical protein
MKPNLPAMLSAALLLGSCAAPTRFIEKGTVAPPSRLEVHLAPFEVANPEDLRRDLDLDSAGLRTWVRPFLEAPLRKIAGIDTVTWIDSMDLATRTERLGKTEFETWRPVDTSGTGWVMVLSFPRTDRVTRPGATYNGTQFLAKTLDLDFGYTLVERGSGMTLAFGSVQGRAGYTLSIDRGDWEKVATEAGRILSERLPAKAAPAKAAKATKPAPKKTVAPDEGPRRL